LDPVLLLRLLHLMSVGFMAGALLTALMVQSLLQRAIEPGDRTSLARTASTLARIVVNPLAYAGFFSGLVYWYGNFSQRYQIQGVGRLMKCTPIYVHIMLACGFLALGMVQVWKGRSRKLADAVEKNAPATELRQHATRGWLFGMLGLFFIGTAYCVAALHLPNKISPACFSDSFHD
jgi:hypothetical protein